MAKMPKQMRCINIVSEHVQHIKEWCNRKKKLKWIAWGKPCGENRVEQAELFCKK